MIRKYLEEAIGSHIKIDKLHGEASSRSFFRIHFPGYSRVAMVYPDENRPEIERIMRLTALYREHGLRVPEIHEVIGNRVILLQDLGSELLQKTFRLAPAEEKRQLVQKIAVILGKLHRIPAPHTERTLDPARLKWEMDFFLEHFVGPGAFYGLAKEALRPRLYDLAESIADISHFAHRDFHSRNLLYHRGDIYLVDFQDSLKASPYYDLVSIAFDAYLDLGPRRELLLAEYEQQGLAIDREQFFLTALQRNIKALGSFGFQVHVRKNLAYKKYTGRTLRHIAHNPYTPRFLHK